MYNDFLVFLVLLWIGISVWTAIHAKDHGKTRLWGVVVLITGIFGLIFYSISLASD